MRLPNLGDLRELNLQFNDVNDEAAQLLCEEPFFQRLSRIRCGGNPMTNDARQLLRARFRSRVSFVAERDEDHLYNIQNEPYRFTAGFGLNRVQVLFYGTDEELRLALFDHEGNFLQAQVREAPEIERPDGRWQDLPMETRTAWLAKRDEAWRAERDRWLGAIDFRPATIRVKRFRVLEAGISDFPGAWAEALTTPDHPDRADALEWLDGWLTEGKFVYELGHADWWLNAAGEVTDT
jgi:hypothetical protein